MAGISGSGWVLMHEACARDTAGGLGGGDEVGEVPKQCAVDFHQLVLPHRVRLIQHDPDPALVPLQRLLEQGPGHKQTWGTAHTGGNLLIRGKEKSHHQKALELTFGKKFS